MRIRAYRSRYVVRFLALGSILASSCSLIVTPTKGQCITDSDCEARGFSGTICSSNVCTVPSPAGPNSAPDAGTETGGPWGCLGDVRWPAQDTTVSATVSAPVARLLGNAPFAGVAAKICPQLDVACASPLGDVISDATGMLTLPVHRGFRGHVRFDPQAAFPNMIPLLFFFHPSPRGGIEMLNASILLTSKAELSAIASVADAQLTPGLGHLFFTAFDCTNAPTAKVAVRLNLVDPSTVTAYVDTTGQPSKLLDETTSNGGGAILNVPTGFVTVTGTSATAGRFFSVTITVRPDTLTAFAIVPSPL